MNVIIMIMLLIMIMIVNYWAWMRSTGQQKQHA